MFPDLVFLFLLIIATNWGYSRGFVKAVVPFFQCGMGIYTYSLLAAPWFALLYRFFQSIKFPAESLLAILVLLVGFVLLIISARFFGKIAAKIIDIVLWDGLFSRIPGAVLGLALMVLVLNGLQILFLDFLPSLSFPEKTRFQSLLFTIADQGRLWVMGR